MNVEEIVKKVKECKDSEVKYVIEERIKEFDNAKKNHDNSVFNELCFCLLTANYSAAGGIKIQQKLGNEFLTLSKEELEDKLRKLGHRFPKARAEYIVFARRHKDKILELINSGIGEQELREWLVKNIKGLGYKEASHFLRYIGYKDVAIVDFHIIDLLVRYEIISRPKTLTRKRYMEIEGVLREISNRVGIKLGELDLYLWHIETGKVMK